MKELHITIQCPDCKGKGYELSASYPDDVNRDLCQRCLGKKQIEEDIEVIDYIEVGYMTDEDFTS